MAQPPRTELPRLVAVLRAVGGRIGSDNLNLASAGMAFFALLAIPPALAAMFAQVSRRKRPPQQVFGP